ncbi:MAG: GntR family transcriptional regulator [Anaerolineales bacterium]|nr:GntR family transcriptional regulator [Anaerolineales bacterium]
MSEHSKERATDRAERHLIEGIVSGAFPPNTDLPGERTLSKDLDIARPALREAMQRLSRDGWLDIQQGKPTRIRDYLQDGNLNILAGLLKADPDLVPNLVPDLLEMWQLLAPQYTSSSVRRAPGLILDLLESFSRLPDEAEEYARSMWKLHHMLIAYCDNLVYGLIFNTFKDFYHQLATYYYANPEHREAARNLWAAMIPNIEALDTETASRQVYSFISSTTEFWKNITFEQYQKEVLDDSRQLEDKVEKKKKKKKK